MIKTKVHKPKGSRFWKLFVEQDGKYKIVFKSESKSEINKKRAKYQSGSIDKAADINKMTFVDLYKEFAQHKINVGNNPTLGGKLNSLKVYMSYYRKHIAINFDHKILVNGVTENVAEVFFNKLRSNGVSWIQTENVVMTFKTALKYARKKQYISSVGPMLDFKCKEQEELVSVNPSDMQYKTTPMISLQEANRLFKILDPNNIDDPSITDYRNFAIVAVFLFCGLRMSELRGLKWNAINLDAEVPTITIKHTLVGTDEGYGKAEGSRRTFIIHPVLLEVLREWKNKHTKHFTPRKITWVFPTLRVMEYVVPLAEKTVRDMLNVAYAKLGFAEIEYKADKSNPLKKRIVVKWSKFGTAPTKTFRHFAATSLLAGQNSNPELTDKFLTNFIGHKNKKVTEGIYGNHLNLNTSIEHHNKEAQALAKAIPLSREVVHEFKNCKS